MATDMNCETWWNGLGPEMRVKVFRLITLRSPEQMVAFSSRRWHELHRWMRDDLRKLYSTPGLVDTCDLVSYFRAQERLGRGQCIHRVLYFVLSQADRESFPELGHSYAIAIKDLQRTDGKSQHWLVTSEAAYDEEVLLALSPVGLSTPDETPHQ